MLLFICHATEDKDFVRPLAESLRQDFDVWYDEYQLTLGDSLLQKINEGLSTCDFGVVVFSPAFFDLSKKWTRTELGGLFALEGSSRKIILPIRKDLTPEELTQRLPTMGDRISVSAAEGLAQVVEQIKLAVQVSERKRQLTFRQSATLRARSLDQNLKEKHDSIALINGEEGARLIAEGYESLIDALQSELATLSAQSQILKFQTHRSATRRFFASTAYRVTLGLAMRDLAVNSASGSHLDAKMFLRSREHYNDPVQDLEEITFEPSFKMGKHLVWSMRQDGANYSTDELVGFLIDRITTEVEKRGTGG